ncbi:hypothetical protein [Lysobacter enzymogenes]|uniref:hypothetical protein n=1 Tax=Lysobacter enzymogenes TaxID=69 RepID=UPI001A96A545|nr:hypothetical protein [Lysobacter enzymogenes]QQP96063.1 hypothetical protein JHW38_23095 [Lysobacter enzymogenes]
MKAIAKSDIAAIGARFNAALIFPDVKTKIFVIAAAPLAQGFGPALLFRTGATSASRLQPLRQELSGDSGRKKNASPKAGVFHRGEPPAYFFFGATPSSLRTCGAG